MIKTLFIVPYRNREAHKVHFLKYMEYLLEDYDKNSFDILLIHQKDDRPFNRGAVKNIGFIYAREKYSNYKDINFVFNDIDTLPCIKNTFNYETKNGVVKHYYGFDACLGGIFSIKGADFEKINGFPNLWTWGFEDNIIYYRVMKELELDRSQFVKFGNMEVIQTIDSLTKITEKTIRPVKELMNNNNGLSNIKNYVFNYNIEEKMVDVEYFDCGLEIPSKVISVNLDKKQDILKNNVKNKICKMNFIN